MNTEINTSNADKKISELKEKYESLVMMYNMTTIHLQKVQNDLLSANQNLKKVNASLMESLKYAKHIQDAFIMDERTLQYSFEHSFLIHKPKDIVSGDFAWYYHYNKNIFLAIGDCTGHGVPGAMLSIFVVNVLNQIANSTANDLPSELIKSLDERVTKYLTLNSNFAHDSLEIGIIRFNTETNQITFAGSKRPLVIIRNGEEKIFQGSRFVIGNPKAQKKLEDVIIDVEPNDMVYLFSDGFSDQFGSAENKKFGSKRFVELLKSISTLAVKEQSIELQKIFDEWKGNYPQMDDVIVLGLKIMSNQ